MDSLWTEFRNAPTAYLQSHRITMDTLITSMIQVLSSDHDRNDHQKLIILGVWQEMAPVLFKDPERLEDAITALKNIFLQQRPSASSLFLCQVLCTLTTLLIMIEKTLAGHNQRIVEAVAILFDVIEKVKSESNRMLKCTACECLRELELAYPGLLCSKVGHFYGMSQAENSYVHQNYMALFATVLEHTVQKYLLEHSNSSASEENLIDLLSYSDPLKSFSLADNFKQQASALLKQPPIPASEELESVDFHEVKRGIAFILDNCHLFTPSCLVYITQRLIRCLQVTSLAPKMLKRLFQYSSCQDLQLFQLVLLLRVQFGQDICDEGDDEKLRKWLMIIAGQPSLSDQLRGLVWEWLIHWPWDSSTSEDGLSDGDTLNHSQEYEAELKKTTLKTSVFDSNELFLYKCKARCLPHFQMDNTAVSSTPVSDLVVNVLKPVQCGIAGPPAVTLYRALFAHYISCRYHHTIQGREIGMLVLELVKKFPKFIPHTIDFISAVQKHWPESPLPLNLLSEVAQHLTKLNLGELISALPLYLMFIRHAATHPQINPVVLLQLLSRVLSGSSLCEQGPWEIGNTLLDICTIVMRTHHTEAVFRDISDLLQLIAQKYGDLDIEDRARFYHQLLLTVSEEKLSAIVTLASDSSAGSSLADIVEARISDTIFPSAPPVRKISGGSHFLTLHRIEEIKNMEEDSQDSKAYQREEEMELVVNEYLQSLHSDQHIINHSSPVQLKFKIEYTKQVEDVSHRIYAVVLRLSTEAPYHPSPDIYIPSLCIEGNGTRTHSASKVLTLTFYPKEPVPATFNISAVFSNEDGATCVTDLQPITIEFRDLFQPLPKSLLEKGPSHTLFSELWKSFSATQLQDSSGNDRHGILSTMHLDIGSKDWDVSCSRWLSHLEVSGDTKEEKETDEHRIMIFLPPSCHLLLKFQVHEESTTVFIASDNWKLLPLVNSYLLSLAARKSLVDS